MVEFCVNPHRERTRTGIVSRWGERWRDSKMVVSSNLVLVETDVPSPSEPHFPAIIRVFSAGNTVNQFVFVRTTNPPPSYINTHRLATSPISNHRPCVTTATARGTHTSRLSMLHSYGVSYGGKVPSTDARSGDRTSWYTTPDPRWTGLWQDPCAHLPRCASCQEAQVQAIRDHRRDVYEQGGK